MHRMIISFVWYGKFSVRGVRSEHDFELIVFIEKSNVITFSKKNIIFNRATFD